MRRELAVEQHRIVAEHVGMARVRVQVVLDAAVAHHRLQARRAAVRGRGSCRRDDRAAATGRSVRPSRTSAAAARTHSRRDQVEAAALVVGAEVAPVRACRPLLPSRTCVIVARFAVECVAMHHRPIPHGRIDLRIAGSAIAATAIALSFRRSRASRRTKARASRPRCGPPACAVASTVPTWRPAVAHVVLRDGRLPAMRAVDRRPARRGCLHAGARRPRRPNALRRKRRARASIRIPRRCRRRRDRSVRDPAGAAAAIEAAALGLRVGRCSTRTRSPAARSIASRPASRRYGRIATASKAMRCAQASQRANVDAALRASRLARRARGRRLARACARTGRARSRSSRPALIVGDRCAGASRAVRRMGSCRA